LSKFTKLLKNPKLFFKDALIKKEKIVINKTIDSYNYNIFYPYTHLIHSGENVSGLSHINLWIPYFEKANIQFIILVRDYEFFLLLKDTYPYKTILLAKNKKDIDNYFKQLSYVKACFYPSNTGNNLHLLQYDNIKHIFIGHGDSDKSASAHKYFRIYDENWVAGDAHIDRFKNASFDFLGLKHIKVGRPNLKDVLTISRLDWKKRFNGKINLLYLSTWEGVYEEQNYTSVEIMKKVFNTIPMKVDTISIKLHPWIGKRDNSLLNTQKELETILRQKNVEFNIFDKNKAINSLVKESNIFICDISAVITDSLAADAPIFVYIPKDKDIKLSQSKMGYKDYTYIFSTADELLQKMVKVLNGDDYLKKNRKEAMEYILGSDETISNKFIEKLQQI